MGATRRRAGRGLDIRLKRVFAAPEADDGERILVDRLWPRGMRKDKAALDGWMKDLAPSTELRRWFGHDPARWDGFRERYEAELAQHRDLLDELRQRARKHTVTLLFAARDEAHNEAVVLKDVLLRGRS
ncbi:MAG TPA: DUF488 domain-containing protein [Stellaceae bacterium]|nr:DUF488 domain-containing protein [Stellaceae bacterium]